MPLPLYAGLTIEEQLQVFEPTPKYTRKVIVSTNIAEASVTLEGVVYVIDTGFVKVSCMLKKRGRLPCLIVVTLGPRIQP